MSTPPPASPPPPGGYYPSPPPAKSNNAGCFKAVGITCGVLLLLGFIATVVIGRLVVDVAKKGGGGGFVGTVFGVVKTTQDGVEIQKAVLRYHDRYNKYPDTLTDLVPDTLTDGKILHSSIDPDKSPGHVSWTYHKPPEGAPGSTPLLEFHYQQPGFDNAGAPVTQGGITITLDGQQSTTQAPVTPPSAAKPIIKSAPTNPSKP